MNHRLLLALLLLRLGAMPLPTHAQGAAIDSLTRVARTATTDTLRARTLCRLCDELAQAGRFDTAEQVGQQGIGLAMRIGDLRGFALCQHRLGNMALTRGDLQTARLRFEQGIALYQQDGHLQGQALLYNSLGLVFRNLGQIDSARHAFSQSLSLYTQARNPGGQAKAQYSLAVLAQQTGDYPQASELFRQSLRLARKVGDRAQESSALQGMGNVANLQGDYPRALDYYQRSLRLSEAAGDSAGVANRLINLGALFLMQEDYPRALACYRRSLRIREGLGSRTNLVAVLLGLGNAHNQQRQFDQAKHHYARALDLSAEAGDSLAVAYCLGNLGLIDDTQGRHEQANAYFERSLRISQALDDREGVAIALANLASNANLQQRFAEGRKLSRQALDLGRALGHLQIKQQASNSLYVADSALGNWRDAFGALRLYKVYSDSVKNDEQSRALGRLESQAEYERQAEIDRLRAEEARQRDRDSFTWMLGTAGGGLFLLLIVALTLYRSRQKEKQANAALRGLNEEINQKTFEIIAINSELQATLTELYDQRAALEAQHTKIEDSIRYASRIQTAILPAADQLADALPPHFIHYQPRDIVSGDFYWLARAAGRTYLAVVDCTGHGVPGAFMSVLGANLLHQIVEETGITRPAAILAALDRRIAAMLRQQAGGESQDGMDVALIVLDEADSQGGRAVEFVGAGRPLWHVRQGSLFDYKPSAHSCGGRQNPHKEFVAHRLDTQVGDRLYLFSDGVTDQFGGPHGRKLGPAGLQAFLVETAAVPIGAQGETFAEFFHKWMAGRKQLDDVLMVGIEV